MPDSPDEQPQPAPLSQVDEAILAKYSETMRQMLGMQEALMAAYRGRRTEILRAA